MQKGFNKKIYIAEINNYFILSLVYLFETPNDIFCPETFKAEILKLTKCSRYCDMTLLDVWGVSMFILNGWLTASTRGEASKTQLTNSFKMAMHSFGMLHG